MNEENIKKIQDVIAKDLPSTSNVDILSARLHRITGLSEETTKVIANEWKKAVGTVAVVLIAVALFKQYKVSTLRQSEESALVLSNIQAQYASLLTSGDINSESSKPGTEESRPNSDPQTLRARAAISFRDNLALFSRHKSNPSFQDIGLIYHALDKIESGDIPGGRSTLQKDMRIAVGSTLVEPSPSKLITHSDFTKELGKLLLIKTSLRDSNANIAEIRERLKQVAFESQMVSVEAIVMLFRLCSSTEDRVVASEVMNKVLAVHPEFSELLQSEAKSYGII